MNTSETSLPGATAVGSMQLLGRPVLVNEINGFVSVKINEEICCVTLRIVYIDSRVSEASNRAARIKI